MPLGAYIHIPFCGYKCHFCDFVTSTRTEQLQVEYCAVLKQEIEQRIALMPEKPVLDTIFYGGGTPGILDPQLLTEVHQTLLVSVEGTVEGEITLETTPEVVDLDKARLWLDMGINRLSIGIESFDDNLLTLVGRGHTAAQAIGAVEMATKAGFENISCDLMYGLPEQNMGSWRQSLSGFVDLAEQFPQIKHISVYSLELGVTSPLSKMFPADSKVYVSEEEFEHQYRYLLQTLDQAGFQQYEISNFSKPGFESRHNLNYWQGGNYLAFGVSAHRFLSPYRSSNWKSLPKYMADCMGEETCELIDQQTSIKEAIMLGLRMTNGIELSGFEQKFGLDLVKTYPDKIALLTDHNMLTCLDGRLKLTENSQPVANLVIGEFF